jgi:hypothetical protein
MVHNMVDVGYKEDPCGITKGNSAEILSTMRKPGLNLIVPIKQLHPGERVEFLLELLRTGWGCRCHRQAALGGHDTDGGA